MVNLLNRSVVDRPVATASRLRIALVCDWYLPRIGGIETQLAGLAGELVAAGHDVTLVTPMPGANVGSGMRVQTVQTRLIPGATLMWSPRGFRRLGETLRAGGFDLVHVHASTVSPAAFAAIYHAQRAGLPTVSTLHSIPGRWRGVFGWLHRRFRWGDWNVAYAAVSRRVARELQPFVRQEIAILPNAIDPTLWQPPVGATSPRDDLAIACVMRLVPRKRADMLLEAFRSVRTAMPNRRITLHFVGDGPSRRALERRAAAYGLATDIRFHGTLPPNAIRRILTAADIFALPCRVEAFGIAALEARAVGLPVLAMAETGVGEFIVPGRDGYLAANDHEFAERLHMLCSDDEDRERITRHNRMTPVDCTWERSHARHHAVYEQAQRLAGLPAP